MKNMLDHLKSHLKGKVVVLGIGNTLRSDDGAGSILVSRLKQRSPFLIFDSGPSPENYLGKIIREKPDTIVIIDAADFGGKPGEFTLIEGESVKTTNLFSTHNASISLTTNYLQSNLKVDIIILVIQPESIIFGDTVSLEVERTIEKLENFFNGQATKKEG